MANSNMTWDETVNHYVLRECLRESAIAQHLRDYTSTLSEARMQISPAQGQWMAWLVKTLQVSTILELGVFTGYSALWMAEALPAQGCLVACERDQRWIEIALKFWAKAGVADKIELKRGEAIDSLEQLLQEKGAGFFDLAFIDADKARYDEYYEAVLRLVREGGVILLDNMLQMGRVAYPDHQEKSTVVMRQLNKKLQSDQRVEVSLIPFGDGLTLVTKR